MRRVDFRTPRTGLRFVLVACAVSAAVFIMAAMCTGCGDSDGETRPLAGDVEETFMGSDSPLYGEETTFDEETIEAGSTEFSLEGQSIGEGIVVPDVAIHSISWSDHGDYFRIMFTLGVGDASELNGVPSCSTRYTNEHYSLAITFDDIRTYQFDYAPFINADVPVSLGDPVVEHMQRKPSGRDDPIWFEVVCAHSEAHPGTSSRPHRLMYSTRPATVILDIQTM